MPDRKYISLQKASEYTPFDSNYLGLLIRKGWLLGIKNKGKWYTTQEAIDEYMKNSARVKIPPKRPLAKSLLTQIGIGLFFFIALLLFGAVSNAFFLEEGKREVIEASVEEAWSSGGGAFATVSENREIISSGAIR